MNFFFDKLKGLCMLYSVGEIKPSQLPQKTTVSYIMNSLDELKSAPNLISNLIEIIREAILSEGRETTSAEAARRDFKITRDKWDRYIAEGYITPLYKPYTTRPVYSTIQLRALLSTTPWPESEPDEPPGNRQNEAGSCSPPPQTQVTTHPKDDE
jgi:hypothetical protein